MVSEATGRPRPVRVLPLAPMQHGLLAHAAANQGSDPYVVQTRLDLTPLGAPADVRRTIAVLFDRYAALRTAFQPRRSGDWIQVRYDDVPLPFTAVDLRRVDDPESRIEVLALADRDRGFDLGAPPLVRFLHAQLPDHDTLVITHHHACLDGWSVAVLLDDLARITVGAPLAADPGDEAYADRLVSLARARAEAEPDLAPVVAGLPPTLVCERRGVELPTRVASVLLDADLWSHLDGMGGATRSDLLLAATGVALGRYLGRTEVTVGTVVSGRDDATLLRSVGLLANTVARAVRWGPHDRWEDLLARPTDGPGRYGSDVALPELVAASGSALLDVLLVVENYPRAEPADGSPRVLRSMVHSVSEFSVAIVVEPDGDGLRADVVAVPAAEQAARWLAEQLPRELEGLQPTALVRLSPSGTPVQPALCGAAPVQPIVTVAELWRRSARRYATQVALDTPAGALGYAALDNLVASCAMELRAEGAQPGQRIAVSLPTDAPLVVAFLAVTAAGAVPVLFDPDLPAARRHRLLERVAAVESQVVAGVPAALSAALDAPLIGTPLAGAAASQVETRRSPQSEAWIVFTSGSTGEPKAVSVSHRGVAELTSATAAAIELGPGNRFLLNAAPGFDAICSEILTALTAGATLVTDSPAARAPRAALQEMVAARAVTHAIVTPSLLQSLDPRMLATVRHLGVAGEACSPGVLRDWAPGRTLVNLYGPCEATVCATISDALAPGDEVRIGHPLPGFTGYVLDPYLQPVRAGGVGELWLAGEAVGHGYPGEPGLTAAAFVADPRGRPGSRMYRTGDLVQASSGGLRFVGRADRQLELGGRRFEPAEIESALERLLPGATAVALPYGDRLAAVVCTSEPDEVSPDHLLEALRREVPGWMVPARVLVRTALPLTRNGKLDEAALVAELAAGPARARPTRSPRAGVVAEIVADVLGMTDPDPTTSLLQLGASSLTLVRLAGRIQAVLGVRVDLSQLLGDLTVDGLVALTTTGPTLPALPVRSDGDPVLAASSQLRLWLLESLGTPGAYVIPVALELTGPLDPEAMRRALEAVADRHDILRTVFAMTEDGLVQRVRPAGSSTGCVSVTDVPQPPEGVLEAERRLGLDLLGGALPWRGRLARLPGAERWLLVLTVHHIAVDAWSIGVLLNDLADRYGELVVGGVPVLSTGRTSFADFVGWQRDRLGSADDPDSLAATQLSFWEQQLAGCPAETVLPDVSGPRSGRAGLVTADLEPATAVRIAEVAKANGATPFMVLHAALVVTLTRFGVGPDSVVGTTVSNRAVADLDEVVGPMINTVPLRLVLDPVSSFGEVVAAARRADLAAFDHADVPFEQIVQRINPTRRAEASALVQITLDLNDLDGRMAPPELPAIVVSPYDGADVGLPSRFDLSWSVTGRSGGGLVVGLRHDDGRHDAQTAARLLDAFVEVLDVGTADPERMIKDLPDTEIAAASTSPPAGRTGQGGPWDRICTVAAARPASAALRDPSGTWTYAELLEEVGRRAETLRRRHVGRGALVAVMLAPDRETVAWILATLAVGAAFVPVAPDCPPGRLADTLEDTSPAIVLTRGLAAGTLGGHLVLDVATAVLADVGPVGPGPAAVRPHDPAYVIHTSGSTGRPKGVVVEHVQLAAYLDWAVSAYPEAAGVTLLHSALTFDLTVTALFTPLCLGGLLVVGRLALDDVSALAADELTFMKITPSHLPLLDSLPPAFTPTGRLVIGGEVLTARALAGVRNRRPGLVVTNDYGPTETTVNCVEWVLAPGEAVEPGTVAIGRPLPGNTAHVLDPWLRPVPAGVTGELYVGGAGVARGYLRRPGLTAQRFVASPYDTSGARLYRTGDLVRQRADGELVCLGRADDQVKVAGHRVELGEIESVLSAVPGVVDVAVDVRGGAADPHLVAWVVGAVEPAGLRRQLAEHLPPVLRPRAVHRVEELPLSRHGKRDRTALTEPANTGGVDAAHAAADGPATILERVVASVFAEVLGLSAVTPDADLFAAGGTSLTVIRVASLLSGRLGLPVSPVSVLSEPTPRGVARALAGIGGTDGTGADSELTQTTAERMQTDLALLRVSDLPPGWMPTGGDLARPQTVLLTGANGFLGLALLVELLQTSSAQVRCLVRAEDQQEGRERIRAAARRAGLASVLARHDDRWSPVCGSLDQERLGLDPDAWERLAEAVDVVVHNGAQITPLLGYDAHRPANVLGTAAVLALAVAGGAGLHFVSSTSVCSPRRPARVVAEGTRLPPDEVADNGYVQSKWVAEELVLAAAGAGVPVRSYRPSRVAGASGSGVGPPSDALWRVARACAVLDAVPEVPEQDLEVDLVPVDWVAAQIVAGVVAGFGGPRIVHLCNPEPVPATELVAALRRAGHARTTLPAPEWEERLRTAGDHDERLTHQVVLGAGWPVGRARHRVVSSRPLGSPRLVGPAVLDRYVSYYTRSGYFPTPPTNPGKDGVPADEPLR